MPSAEIGVIAIICVGTNLESNRINLGLIQKFSQPKLFLSLGIHPTEIESENKNQAWEFIRNNIGEAKCIGEIGLDFWQKGIKKDFVGAHGIVNSHVAYLIDGNMNIPITLPKGQGAEHSTYLWADYESALSKLTYENDREILKRALEEIKRG